MELNNFTIDILRPNQQLAAELPPCPNEYILPALPKCVQNSNSECRGCNNNNFVKRMSSETSSEPGAFFCTIADTSAVETDGTGLCDRH